MEGEEEMDYASAWGLGRLIFIQMSVRTAIELKVFDIIASSGPRAQLSCDEIVSKIPGAMNPNAAANLERILRLLGINSILSMSSRPCQHSEIDKQETTYALTKVSRCLVSNTDKVPFHASAQFFSEREMVECLYSLKDAVLKPECLPVYDVHHGVSFFEDVMKKPRLSCSFNELMMVSSKKLLDQMLDSYKGFGEVDELMDVGGGIGTSIMKIVSCYPHVRGINFDLPHVISEAPEHPGVQHVEGNMFETLPNAQNILLQRILHDWDDDRCVKLLRNCWKALPENGKVIVLERIAPQTFGNNSESINVIPLDFIMMVYHTGKERTRAEFDRLARDAGFITESYIFAIPATEGYHILEFIKTSSA